MSKILNTVKYAFKSHPIISNSVIYGSLYVGAEFSQQTLNKKILTESPEPYDQPTLVRYSVYGTAIQGPLLFFWYRWLDNEFLGKTYKIIAKKVLLDQFLMTPQIVVIFYTAMALMEQKNNIFEECKQKFIPTFKTSCLFWIPVQSINFMLIPPIFRVVYVGSCSFAWVNILCWYKRQEY